MDDTVVFILESLAIFVVSWAVLLAVMYFVAPFFAKFEDRRSRVLYSLVYTLPFAVIFGLGLGGTMSIIYQSNLVIAVISALVIVFVLVMIQSYLMNYLTARGIIKMEEKAKAAAPKKNVKGKRK